LLLQRLIAIIEAHNLTVPRRVFDMNAFRNLCLTDNFQKYGFFKLLSFGNTEYAGLLKKEEGELTLDIFSTGSFLFNSNLSGLRTRQVDIYIIGTLEGGIPCTITQALRINSQSSGSFETHTYRIHCLYIGEIFDNEAGIAFTSLTLQFSSLDSFMCDGSYFSEPRDNASAIYNIVLNPPPLCVVNINAIHAEATIGCSTSLNRTNTLRKIEVTPSIHVKMNSSKSHEFCFEVIRNLQDFFTLLIGNHVRPIKVSAKSLTGEDIHLFPSWMCKSSNTTASQSRVFISFNSINNVLPTLMAKWFELSDQLRDVYNLLFSSIYSEDMYIESRFLSLIQALEAYSRTKPECKYIDTTQYETLATALYAAIPNGTPQDLKSSLKNRIMYGNEYSLRKRLNTLLNSLDPVTRGLVCDDRSAYVDRLVATRNYLTHYTSELRRQAWNADKYFYACQSMRVMLSIFLLIEIGFEESSVYTAFIRNSDTSRIIPHYKSILQA
jgi:hypothetical protein